jgi:hypothetical protein
VLPLGEQVTIVRSMLTPEIKRLATSCDHKTMPSVWRGSDIEEIDH